MEVSLCNRLEIRLRQLQPHKFLMLRECMRMCLYSIHITSSVGLIARLIAFLQVSLVCCCFACSAVLDYAKHDYARSWRCHHRLHSFYGQVFWQQPCRLPHSLACPPAWPDSPPATGQSTCNLASNLAVQCCDAHLLPVEVPHSGGLCSPPVLHMDRHQQPGACPGCAHPVPCESWPQATSHLCCAYKTATTLQPVHPDYVSAAVVTSNPCCCDTQSCKQQ